MTQNIFLSDTWKSIYALLCLVSIISSLIIPIVYAISPKFRHHPSGFLINFHICRILVIICLFEMIFSYHLMIWASKWVGFFNF